MHISDPFCQNETLLCTWPKLSSSCIIKVYIIPFIMMFTILKSDNPSEVMPFDRWGIDKYEMDKQAFKVWGLSLGQ